MYFGRLYSFLEGGSFGPRVLFYPMGPSTPFHSKVFIWRGFVLFCAVGVSLNHGKLFSLLGNILATVNLFFFVTGALFSTSMATQTSMQIAPTKFEN